MQHVFSGQPAAVIRGQHRHIGTIKPGAQVPVQAGQLVQLGVAGVLRVQVFHQAFAIPVQAACLGRVGHGVGARMGLEAVGAHVQAGLGVGVGQYLGQPGAVGVVVDAEAAGDQRVVLFCGR